MAPSAFTHVDLRDVPVKNGVQLRSAEVLRSPAHLAIIRMDVNGKLQGLRFDLAKQVFLDSLGSKRLDKVVHDLREPLTLKIQHAKRRKNDFALP